MSIEVIGDSRADVHDKGLITNVKAATDLDRSGLDSLLAREREWYRDAERFQTRADLYKAFETGQLVELHQSPDVLPINRFRTRADGFDPFLTPNAWRAVHVIGEYWREELGDLSFLALGSLRIAVTSMSRHQLYQDRLVAAGRLAAPDSTHCTGNAFDIDASGYYRLQPNGVPVSHVDPRRHSARLAIGEELKHRFGGLNGASILSDEYHSLVTSAVIRAGRRLHEEGRINLVEEFAGTENACLHIAAHPDF